MIDMDVFDYIGTLAQLPPPSAEHKDKLYVATDGGTGGTGGVYYCNGATWISFFDLGGSGASLRSLTDGTYTTIDTSVDGVAKVQLDSEVGMDSLVLLGGGRKIASVDGMTIAALPANTYSNGTLGVGATLTASTNVAWTDLDGITGQVGDTYLIAFEGTMANNGIYDLTSLGSAGVSPWVLTRNVNFDQAADWQNGIDVHVARGNLNGGRIVRARALTYTMGTTGIAFRPAITMGDIMTGVERSRFVLFEDFGKLANAVVAVTTTGVHVPTAEGYYWGTGGAAEGVSQGDSTNGGASPAGETVYGAADLATGTTTTGRCFMTGAQALAFAPKGRYEWYGRVKVPVVSDGTNTFNVKLGFFISADGAPTDGIYLEAISGTANWQATARVGGVNTTVDTGTAYNTNFRAFSIIIPGDGNAYFYLGPALIATITSGLPSGVSLFPGAGILKSAGTTSRSVRLDMIAMDVPGPRVSLFVP